jgi:hypothetical protein
MKEAARDRRNLIDGAQKCGFIRLGRLVESADFSDELKRSGPNLLFVYGRFEIEKSFDVPAHRIEPPDETILQPLAQPTPSCGQSEVHSSTIANGKVYVGAPNSGNVRIAESAVDARSSATKKRRGITLRRDI